MGHPLPTCLFDQSAADTLENIVAKGKMGNKEIFLHLTQCFLSLYNEYNYFHLLS